MGKVSCFLVSCDKLAPERYVTDSLIMTLRLLTCSVRLFRPRSSLSVRPSRSSLTAKLRRRCDCFIFISTPSLVHSAQLSALVAHLQVKPREVPSVIDLCENDDGALRSFPHCLPSHQLPSCSYSCSSQRIVDQLLMVCNMQGLQSLVPRCHKAVHAAGVHPQLVPGL